MRFNRREMKWIFVRDIVGNLYKLIYLFIERFIEEGIVVFMLEEMEIGEV